MIPTDLANFKTLYSELEWYAKKSKPKPTKQNTKPQTQQPSFAIFGGC